MPEPLDIGDAFAATVTFAVGETPTDPTTVTAQVRKPDATVTTHTYSESPGQPDPHIVRSGLGVFELALVPDQAGVWVVRWVGTGEAAAAVEQLYTVAPSSIQGGPLLASYVGDPAARPVDQVRLHVGDTATPFLLSDSELMWFLDQADADGLSAAAMAAGALAARFAGLVDASTGDESRSYSQRSKGYAELAERLAGEVATKGRQDAVPVPWAGGLTYSERQGRDPDLVPPYFYEGMDDVPAIDARRGVA